METPALPFLRMLPADFFREFYVPLHRYLQANIGGSASEIEDLAQETLLQAWKDRERFRGDVAPLGWILAIARHRLIDIRRRRGRARDAHAALQAVARMADTAVSDQALRNVELGRHIRAALQKLPENYRDVLVRRYLDGEPVRTIADALGETEKTVESRLHRARDAFRDLLQKGALDAEL